MAMAQPNPNRNSSPIRRARVSLLRNGNVNGNSPIVPSRPFRRRVCHQRAGTGGPERARR